MNQKIAREKADMEIQTTIGELDQVKRLGKPLDTRIRIIIEEPEKKPINVKGDPWLDLDIDDIAVDTGIEDLSLNHDHYLYGTPKKHKS